MTKIEFKFDIDQRIVTAFEAEGIIEMLGVDEGGIRYYVKTKDTSSWFKEGDIRHIPTTDE